MQCSLLHCNTSILVPTDNIYVACPAERIRRKMIVFTIMIYRSYLQGGLIMLFSYRDLL